MLRTQLHQSEESEEKEQTAETVPISHEEAVEPAVFAEIKSTKWKKHKNSAKSSHKTGQKLASDKDELKETKKEIKNAKSNIS